MGEGIRLAVCVTSPGSLPVKFLDNFQSEQTKIFYVTYAEPCAKALRFNPGWSWSQNRNYLAYAVPDTFDYYMFVDYDVLFELHDSGSLSLDSIIISELNRLKPEAYAGGLTVVRDTHEYTNISEDFESEFFLNQVCRIYSRNQIKQYFPIPISAHWWDAASYLNLCESVTLSQGVLKSPSWVLINQESSGYRFLFNYKIGMGQMQRNYVYFKESIKHSEFLKLDVEKYKKSFENGFRYTQYEGLHWKKNSTIPRQQIKELKRLTLAKTNPRWCNMLAIWYQRKYFFSIYSLRYYARQIFKIQPSIW